MQVIEVKYKNGVFIPTVPVTMDEDQEAVIIISEKKPGSQKRDAAYYQENASRDFKDKFPGVGIGNELLELVGILCDKPGNYDKTEYHEHVGRKFK